MPTVRAGHRALAASSLLLALILSLAIAPAALSAGRVPQFSWPDQFQVHTNPFTFDHAPAFGPNNIVVSHHDTPGTGGMQIYTSGLDGSNFTCVTCGASAPPVPNMVPSFRPQGDKILFHSWAGHNVTFGGPGFGGLGSTFWVVNPNGTGAVELTPPELAMEGMDNFHAYFSPDGSHIAWSHIDWNFVTPLTTARPGGGTGKWSIYVGDYVDDSHGPHLTNVRQVRPENGHFYETQWWSPDGRGFLFTESSDAAMDFDLYFYELSTGNITRLTNNHTWTEQAIFTPDGKNVVYMSIKDHQNQWAAWSTTANALNLTPAYDYAIILPLFFGLFLTPGDPPACDLYEINLASGQERRITTDGNDGWIIPELTYSTDGRMLMWTELETRPGLHLNSDPSKQPGDELSLLLNPPPVPTNLLDKGKELPYVVERTRIGEFVASSVGAGDGSSGGGAAAGSAAGGFSGLRVGTTGASIAAANLPNTSGARPWDEPWLFPLTIGAAFAAGVLATLAVYRGRRRKGRWR